jgi:uncharacterized protein
MADIRNLVASYELFYEGFGLVSLIEEVTVPDIKWKSDDYHGGGLMGTRTLVTVLDKLEMTMKMAGFDPRLHNAITLMPGMTSTWKLMSSLVNPGNLEIPQKITVTGRLRELKRAPYKIGKTETTGVICDITYYEEWFDGKTVLKIDLLNNIMVGPDGVDLMATRRRNTGRG